MVLSERPLVNAHRPHPYFIKAAIMKTTLKITFLLSLIHLVSCASISNTAAKKIIPSNENNPHLKYVHEVFEAFSEAIPETKDYIEEVRGINGIPDHINTNIDNIYKLLLELESANQTFIDRDYSKKSLAVFQNTPDQLFTNNQSIYDFTQALERKDWEISLPLQNIYKLVEFLESETLEASKSLSKIQWIEVGVSKM